MVHDRLEGTWIIGLQRDIQEPMAPNGQGPMAAGRGGTAKLDPFTGWQGGRQEGVFPVDPLVADASDLL